jgi:hypothetical protein
MFHDVLANLISPLTAAFDLPDGFVTNRNLFIGFAVALVLAVLAKMWLRSHDERQAAKHEEKQEIAAIARDGPPTFNG